MAISVRLAVYNGYIVIDYLNQKCINDEVLVSRQTGITSWLWASINSLYHYFFPFRLAYSRRILMTVDDLIFDTIKYNPARYAYLNTCLFHSVAPVGSEIVIRCVCLFQSEYAGIDFSLIFSSISFSLVVLAFCACWGSFDWNDIPALRCKIASALQRHTVVSFDSTLINSWLLPCVHLRVIETKAEHQRRLIYVTSFLPDGLFTREIVNSWWTITAHETSFR